MTESYKGAHLAAIVLEEEHELLDGTPIVVNGVLPASVGDTGFFFLTHGDGEAFPYTALVGEQGRYLIAAEHLVAASTASPLAQQLAAQTPDELRARLRG